MAIFNWGALWPRRRQGGIVSTLEGIIASSRDTAVNMEEKMWQVREVIVAGTLMQCLRGWSCSYVGGA